MSLTEKSLSQKQLLFLSQSLPFPAVTFCNFNAIKINSLQAAKNTELFNEVFAIELGKCNQVVFVHVFILARPDPFSEFWETSRLDLKSTS